MKMILRDNLIKCIALRKQQLMGNVPQGCSKQQLDETMIGVLLASTSLNAKLRAISSVIYQDERQLS